MGVAGFCYYLTDKVVMQFARMRIKYIHNQPLTSDCRQNVNLGIRVQGKVDFCDRDIQKKRENTTRHQADS